MMDNIFAIIIIFVTLTMAVLFIFGLIDIRDIFANMDDAIAKQEELLKLISK